MPLMTSREAADLIRQATGFAKPTTEWIRALCAIGILTDHGTGTHARLDTTEIAQFIAEHPYRPVLPFDYLRVSVIEQSASPAFELTPPHRQFRTHAGYDHLNRAGLHPQQVANAIVSTWRITLANAQDVVDRGLPLLGSVKGVVTPRTIYWPRAVVPLVGGGVGFDVDPSHYGHPTIPTGVLLDVPQGNMFELVNAPSATTARWATNPTTP